MKRALVISGGGSRGAFSAGVYFALGTKGISFDYLIGASVGALNVCFPPGRLKNIWQSIKGNRDIYKYRIGFFLTFANFSSLYSVAPLQKLIKKNIDLNWLRNSRKEFRFVSTSYISGEPLVFTQSANPIEALLASSALPGFFPPIQPESYKDDLLIDGGVSSNLPLNLALDMGADEIIAILHKPMQQIIPIQKTPSALEVAGRATGILIDNSMRKDLLFAQRLNKFLDVANKRGFDLEGTPLQKYSKRKKILKIEPLKPLAKDIKDFSPAQIKADFEHGFELGQEIDL